MRLALLSLALLLVASPASAYDIKNDFCGTHINFQYCKCAFHGQYCDAVGMSKAQADAHVRAEFDRWVASKQPAPAPAVTEAALPPAEPAEAPAPASSEEKECQPLYRKGSEGDCVFSGADGTKLDVESAIALEELLAGMPRGQAEVFIGKDRAGNDVRIGIVRKPDGGFVFSDDGEHFYDQPKDAIRPGVWTSVKEGWDGFWDGVKGLVGIGTYVGRDTAGDAEAQQDGQARYDASLAAFKDLRETGRDPEKRLDDAVALQELWGGRAEKLMGEEYDELVIAELSEATGQDAKLIKQVLAADLDGIVDDQLDSAKNALFTLPAQSVATLAKELRGNDFAAGAAQYMREREAGKEPAQVYADLKNGDLPELETRVNKGVATEHTVAMLLIGYEDAYQRYLLAKELKG